MKLTEIKNLNPEALEERLFSHSQNRPVLLLIGMLVAQIDIKKANGQVDYHCYMYYPETRGEVLEVEEEKNCRINNNFKKKIFEITIVTEK